jgi:hypothetical protein
LPLAEKLVEEDKVGVVVPWQDPHAVVDAILTLRNDRRLRLELGANGHRAALRDHDWNRLSTQFVDLMGTFADQMRTGPAARAAIGAATSATASRLGQLGKPERRIHALR